MRCYTALDIPTYVSKINVSLNIMVAMATAITIIALVGHKIHC